MERNEMIEILIEKTKVTREEAVEALEKTDWDLLEAIIYLERNAKVENTETTKIIEVKAEGQYQGDNNSNKESYGGLGTILGRIARGIAKFIRKANTNFFEIRKDNERPIRIPLIIAALLLIFLSVPTVILLIVGLFCGYKYSLSGPNINCAKVNDVFKKVSETADNVKRDFKESYEE